MLSLTFLSTFAPIFFDISQITMDRLTHISEAKFYHYIAIFPIYVFVRLWQATIRMQVDKESRALVTSSERMIGLAWHNRIFFLALCKNAYRKKFPMSALISSSKDGAYLAAFFKLMNVGAVRGSSKHRGGLAILDLIDTLADGSDVFITPDGPRGPSQKAKSGFIAVAKASGARILLMRISPQNYWTVNSWDKFILPFPFSKVILKNKNIANYEELMRLSSEANMTPEEYVGAFLNS